MTKWEVVTFVECRGYNYKGTMTHKNQGQGFVSGKQLRNVWCSSCLKAWKWRENTAEERGAVVVKCIPSIMWEKYKTGKGAESEKRKESSDTRRKKGNKIGSGG